MCKIAHFHPLRENVTFRPFMGERAMGESDNLIDAFGAPEFFCNDLAYVQIAAPGVIRFGLYAFEGEDKILKAKVLLPATVIPAAVKRVTTFMALQMYDRLIGPERPGVLM